MPEPLGACIGMPLLIPVPLPAAPFVSSVVPPVPEVLDCELALAELSFEVPDGAMPVPTP